MSSEEFNMMRIQALEKEMQRLKDLIKEKEDTLALERQRNREMVTEMEVELDKFREDDKS
jgi:predicted  nucleic acid-binding Zn-ribbon protein